LYLTKNFPHLCLHFLSVTINDSYNFLGILKLMVVVVVVVMDDVHECVTLFL